MAWAIDTVGEVRNGGSDTICAGWFADSLKGATGVDYTLQAAAQVACVTTLTTAGADANLIATGDPFTNLMLGNTIRITAEQHPRQVLALSLSATLETKEVPQ